MNLLKQALWLLAFVYGLAVRFRNWLYDRGWLKSEQVKACVICVGNLTMGGSGKTPLVRWIAGRLLEKAGTGAIVSRGYGRLGSDPVLLVPGQHPACEKTGDEPLMLFRNLQIPVAVDTDRVRACRTLERCCAPTWILMDDGFGHRRLRRDMNILVFDGRSFEREALLFPAGRLREPLDSVRRARAAVILNGKTPSALAERLRRYHPDLAVFHGRFVSLDIEMLDGRHLALETITGKKVFAFCGVAHADSFLNMAESLKIQIVGFRRFPDHHRYQHYEIQELLDSARGSADLLLTTEKDMVKIRSLKNSGDIHALRIDIALERAEEFMTMILRR